MKQHDENHERPLGPDGRERPLPADDPRVSAFVLGELEGDELVQFVAEMNERPDLAAEVESFRGLGEVLSSELSGEAASGAALTPLQRARIDGVAENGPRPALPPESSGMRTVRRVAAGLLAASVIGAGILLWQAQEWEPEVRTARSMPDDLDLYTESNSAQPRPSVQPMTTGPALSPGGLEQLNDIGYAEINEPIFLGRNADPSGTTYDLSRQDQLEEAARDVNLAIAELGLSSEGTGARFGFNTTPSSTPEVLFDAPASGGAESGADGWFLGAGQGKKTPGTETMVASTPGAATPLMYRGPGDTTPPRERARESSSRPYRENWVRTMDELEVAAVDDLESLRDRSAGNESYARIVESEFKRVTDAPLSTFSIDVDTASYANVRRYLTSGSLPPVDAVRIEELVNYFDYEYGAPDGSVPFATHTAVTACPWQPSHRLLRIGLQGRRPEHRRTPARNLVFLVDVSGSMNSSDKLPLLQASLKMLVAQLGEEDSVAIVTYAGASGLALPATNGLDKARLTGAIDNMRSGGSTAGAAGIELAYQVAAQNFREGGVNRVILATDGDFNVGISDDAALTRLIEGKRESGVFLSVLGFGTGNLKDSKMEALADHGNGNYSYIDSLTEARKVLVHELGATLDVIAKDVKIQVEFNPLAVRGYRLVGYENRALAARDFNDDTKDAGEIGAGHTVTALYELIPAGLTLNTPGVDALRYQEQAEPQVQPSAAAHSGELCTVKLRYKRPDEDTSTKLEVPVRDTDLALEDCPEDLRFATAVAMFGMKLRGSAHTRHVSFAALRDLAEGALGADRFGYRSEFLRLLDRATALPR